VTLPDKTTPCKWCGTPTTMLGTQMCHGCWQLDRSIRYAPPGALAKMLAEQAILAALPSGEAVAWAQRTTDGRLHSLSFDQVESERSARKMKQICVPLVPAAPAPVLTVGAALALPEVQDGSHWILVDDPPDGYSDGYRVRVAGMEASVCFDVDGMPGDEEEDWGGIGDLNACGFADPCRLVPLEPESRGPLPAKEPNATSVPDEEGRK
jgi:hypothetical protein